ncbi:MAG TPA: matrixin family metalloprotease [Gemmatimonadales bacterium]|nr:matrixin family metalloprotease [Gemmatimonadales bacterium]
MFDRKLPALIATLAVVFACSILWNAFHSPGGAQTSARRKAPSDGALPDPVATAPVVETVRVATAPVSRPASVPVPETPPAQRGGELSYIEQLARAETRRRIRASAGYTYLNEVLAESQDSSLHRWDDRFQRPVRVYLAPTTTVANFQPAFLDAVRAAFHRWEDANVPVRFDLESDSARADVQVRWRVQFDIDRTGQTDLAWDPTGHILSGIITIATFDPKGRPLSTDDIRVVGLHEVGHLIGLDHSSDSSDIMFARTQARDLSPRDIRTALMLYQMAPGPVR